VRLLHLSLLLILAGHAVAGPVSLAIDASILEGRKVADGNVEAYLGLPFAHPPVGDRRWRSADFTTLPEGKIDATRFAAACYQDLYITDWYRGVIEGFGGDPLSFEHPAVSEDCLYLNIWRPSGMQGPLPVIVYIHGGSNQGGWSFEPDYAGHELAAEGAIVVTVAYRLGVFGFFSHSELNESNFALTDLIASLRWIQKYIGHFGGDADRVTLMGESAGGNNLILLTASPGASGLFHRGIVQSAGWALHGQPNRTEQLALGADLAAHLKAPDLDTLKDIPAEELHAAAARHAADSFYPVVDGVTLKQSVPDAIRSGRVQPVDLLIGSNADEWKMYLEHDATISTWEADDVDNIRRRKAIEALGGVDNRASLDRVITAYNYVCTSYMLADYHRGSGKKTWHYYFTRVRPGALAGEMGAYHGAELPYVFGTHADWLPTDDADRALGKMMARYWVNFAATGEPNGEDLPDWPIYEKDTRLSLWLGDDIVARPHRDMSLCEFVGPARD